MENRNKPAYPPNAGWVHSEARGLTKREEFAKAAMQGVIACGKVLTKEAIAETAIEYADELLKQLDGSVEENKQNNGITK